MHEGKSLEAVWHRAVLDLLAAMALIEEGRFLGKITSYKAGHHLDVEAIRALYKHGLLTEMPLPDTVDASSGHAAIEGKGISSLQINQAIGDLRDIETKP